MDKLHRLIYALTLICFLCHCRKQAPIKDGSFLDIVPEDEIYPVNFEKMYTTWNYQDHLATIQADGYHFEHFRLHLENVPDTGFYLNPGIQTISFSEGPDFIPDQTNQGFIHISRMDAGSISGDFIISLHNDFNEVENKTIRGKFRINND